MCTNNSLTDRQPEITLFDSKFDTFSAFAWKFNVKSCHCLNILNIVFLKCQTTQQGYLRLQPPTSINVLRVLHSATWSWQKLSPPYYEATHLGAIALSSELFALSVSGIRALVKKVSSNGHLHLWYRSDPNLTQCL